jgi:hypothetical protein
MLSDLETEMFENSLLTLGRKSAGTVFIVLQDVFAQKGRNSSVGHLACGRLCPNLPWPPALGIGISFQPCTGRWSAQKPSLAAAMGTLTDSNFIFPFC